MNEIVTMAATSPNTARTMAHIWVMNWQLTTTIDNVLI
jgi:hypothetical protein